MKRKTPKETTDPDARIAELVRTLREAEAKLQALTGGQLDAVVSQGDAPYLLRDAQEKLRVSEAAQRALAETQIGILNALPAHIALLDSHGVIVAVNEAWRRFAAANALQSPDFFVGQNYLGACESAHGECADEAQAVAAGIRKVLSGEEKEFALEYPCHSPNEQRWYRLMVTPLSETPGAGAVVMHVNVTQRRLAEEILGQKEREQRRLAEALTIETQRLHESQAVANVGSWETDLATLDVTWTEETLRIFETTPQEFKVTHQGFLERIHPEDRQKVVDAFTRSIGEQGPFAIEHRLLMPDGRIKIVEERWKTFTDATGKPALAVGTCQDITERKQNEAEQSRVFNLSLDMLCVTNFEGRFEQVNPAWTDCLGWTAEELTTRPMNEFILPEDLEATKRTRERIYQGEQVRDFENRYRCKDGGYRWLSWNVHPLLESRKVFAVARDVTERRKNEEQLRLLETCVSRLNDIVLITEAEPISEPGPRILYVNDAFVRRTGFTREEAIGKTPRILQGPKTQRDALDRIRAALTAWKPVREELINYTKSGEEFWLELDIVPVADATGWFTHWVSIERDITERKHTHEALAASQRQYRDLVETSHDLIWAVDAEGRITYLNSACRRIYGREPEEMIGRLFLEFVPPEQYAKDLAVFTEALQTGNDSLEYSSRVYRKDGSIVSLSANARVVRDDQGRVIGSTGFSRDVTESVRIQEALAASQRQYRDLVDTSYNVIWSVDMEGRFTFLNQASRAVFGRAPEEMIGRRFHEFVPEDQHQANDEVFARLFRDGQDVIDYSNRIRRDDGSIAILNSNARVVLDAEGQRIGISGMSQDTTESMRAQEAIAQSEARFRGLFDQAAVGMCLVSTDGDFLRTNARFCEIVGYSPEELLQRDCIATTHPDEREMEAKIVARILAGELQSDAWEKRYIHKAGHAVWCNLTLSLLPGVGGQPPQFVGVIEDISARRAAVEQLRHREQLLGIAGKVAQLGGWSVDFPEVRLTWSDEVCAIHDVPPGTTPALDQALDFYTPESRPVIESAFSLCASDGTPFDLELEVLTAKGRRAWVRAIGQAERDSAGAIRRVQGAFQDISDQKAVEVEIIRTNRALKMLSACNEVLIHAADESDLLETICEIAVASGGYRMAWVGFAQEDAKRTIQPMAHAGEEAGYLSEVAISWDENTPNGIGPAGRTIRTGQPNMSEDMEQDASFHWRDVARRRGYRSVICLPLRNGDRTFGLLGLYSGDVLHAGTEELDLLQDLADDLAFGIGHLRAQRESERIHSAVTKVATAVSASTGAEFFEQLAASMAETLGAAAGYVVEMLPGEPPVARTIAVMVDGKKVENFDYAIPGTPCVHLLADDECVVPDRVAELFPTASDLASLGAQAYVGRRLTNAAGEKIGLIFVLFREPLKETAFITSTLRIFAARATSELERQRSDKQLREQAALLDAAHDAILVRDLDYRIRYWNKGAERLYGWAADEAIGRRASDFLYSDLTEVNSAMQELLKTDRWDGEVHKIGKDGTPILVQASWTLLRDSDGRPTSVLAINRDLTEKKKLEAQFLRAQRMESIGTMAGGIAHDLNNVLAPIMMSVELLKLTTKSEQDQKLLETLLSSAQRGANLVSQVLGFARGVEGQRIPVNVGHLIRELVKVMQDTFPKNINIESKPSAKIWNVIGDPTQIHQVILNLCVNARDAMPTGGTLTIRAESIVVDETYASMNLSASPGSYVVIKVEDSGSGIPPELMERVFDPFFTTKETGKGTGLGLSTTAAIVKSHGGFINLYSEVGKGTKFKIYFPADASKEASEEQSVEQTRLPRGKGELVLVVDDEESIRSVAKSTLERFGYSVMVASHGAEGIAIYVQHQSEIAVILTDMAMPIMDGPSMIIGLKSINPKVRIIGSSGLSSNGGAAKAVGAGVEHFIPKPYTAEAMLKVIRACLDAP